MAMVARCSACWKPVDQTDTATERNGSVYHRGCEPPQDLPYGWLSGDRLVRNMLGLSHNERIVWEPSG